MHTQNILLFQSATPNAFVEYSFEEKKTFKNYKIKYSPKKLQFFLYIH